MIEGMSQNIQQVMYLLVRCLVCPSIINLDKKGL